MTHVAPAWLAEALPEWVRDYFSPLPDERVKFFADALERSKGSGAMVSAESAALGIEPLAWDSRHFGFPCARFAPVCVASRLSLVERRAVLRPLVDAGMKWCRANGIRFVSRRMVAARADEAILFEEQGFRLVDVMLTLTAPLKLAAADNIRPFVERDLPEMRRIAAESFSYSRFFADERFDRAKAGEVYTGWLDNYVDGSITNAGSTILVALDRDTIAGLIAMRRDPTVDAMVGKCVVLIELFAVARSFRGRGYGALLLAAAKNWALSHGASLLEASTWPSATAAGRSYRNAGFEIRETLLTFHCHLD
jgi:GNAT superfamily N-acetyltransferase